MTFGKRIFLPLCLAGVLAGAPAAFAQDTADESRAIERQVGELFKAAKFAEAEMLAQKGLGLCEKSGSVKVFCTSIFEEWLGEIANAQARYSDALAHRQRALQVREAGLPAGHTLIGEAYLRIGTVEIALHRNPEAEIALNTAAAIFARQSPIHRSLAATLSYLQTIYGQSGRFDEAVAVSRRSLNIYLAADGSGPSVQLAKLNLATALMDLGRTLSDREDYAGAEQPAREALQLVDPPWAASEKTLQGVLALLGVIDEAAGRYADAEAHELRALELSTKFSGPADPELPLILGMLGAVCERLNRLPESIAYSTRAIALFDERKQENPLLGQILMRLGQAETAFGHYADAEGALLRAVAVLDRVLPENDPQRANARLAFGRFQSVRGDFSGAEKAYRDALSLAERYSYRDASWRASSLAGLAVAFSDQARFGDAERLLLESVKLEEAAGEARKGSLAEQLTVLASVLRRENRFADAENALLRALPIEQTPVGRAVTLNLLGLIYLNTERYEKAEPLLQEAMAIRTKIFPENHPSRSETLANSHRSTALWPTMPKPKQDNVRR